MSLSGFKRAYKQPSISHKNSYSALCCILKTETNFAPVVHTGFLFSLLESMHFIFGFRLIAKMYSPLQCFFLQEYKDHPLCNRLVDHMIYRGSFWTYFLLFLLKYHLAFTSFFPGNRILLQWIMSYVPPFKMLLSIGVSPHNCNSIGT